EVDHAMRLDPAALRAAIARDLAAGRRPIAVVPTLGTTSTTSIDPVAEVADICAEHDLWLHVDAAWAGTAALCPELRAPFAGWERADSIVVNPHKWMFTPLDCSVLFVRDADRLRQAFAIVPEYLRTDPHPAKVDLMDYGVQLGRRFRALKLWFVLRAFGAEGLRQILRRHVALGREVARRIDADVRFERLAPVPFGVVCFRLVRPDLDEEGLTELNDRALTEINRHGSIFLSHTDVAGRRALRLAVSNLRTEAHHVEAAWTLLSAVADRLGATGPAPATGA
ncbi:MAG: pyridoxal-dependent decarboxylase, partial [Acidobacteriota bacterium]